MPQNVPAQVSLPKIHRLELYILVDDQGEFVVHKQKDEIVNTYDNDIQTSNEECHSRRLLKLILNVPLPEIVELTAIVPEQGAAVMQVK